MGSRTLRLVALGITAFSLWIVASPAGATANHPATALSGLEQGVLADINSLRAQHGLAPLRISSRLTAAARQHSSEMPARGYFSHDSANGSPSHRPIARHYPIRTTHHPSPADNLH